MKLLKNFIKLSGINQRSWLNPLLLALFPAVIIILLQPVKFDRFIFDLNQRYDVNQFMKWHEDTENDKRKETFSLVTETAGIPSLVYYNDKSKIINQHNFNYTFPKTRLRKKPSFADFNNDGVKDISIFTQNKDSLFLNIFDYKNDGDIITNRFITTIGGYNDKLDYEITTLGFYDTNSDSIPEFYFSVAAGFALYPRRLFRYDVAYNSLINSINTGAGNMSGRFFHKEDSIAIVVSGIANGNTRPWYPFPYHDSTSWAFTFDQDLNLKFPPKSFGKNPSSVGGIVQDKNFVYFMFSENNSFNTESKLFKMNWGGEITDSIEYDYPIIRHFRTMYIKGKKHFYFQKYNDSQYLILNTNTFTTKPFNKNKFNNQISLAFENDINNDGEIEYILYNRLKKELFVCDDGFQFSGLISNEMDYLRFITTNFFKELGYGELSVVTDKESQIYRYYENPNRYYKYPLWLVIYLTSSLFVSSILFFQNRRTVNQQKMEQQLADLQLQNLRNQLDPHFTFNVLNSIGNSIYKQDKEAAYDLFQRFTRIIRSSLMVSDKVFRTLKEEIQFTQDYLEFQKIRFKERFTYSFEIDKTIDTQFIKFPKMLIQGFTENAVKHAFYEVNYTGKITIKVFEEENKLIVIIDDNGIGIKQSKKLKATSGSQKGLDILQEQVKQINKLYHKNIQILITDKSEINLSRHGTIITITSSFS